MSLFKNLFGRKKSEATRVPPRKASEDPSKNPNMIRVFDAYGREMFVEKEDWRTKVLPGTLKANWDDPAALHDAIAGALNDGFFADILQAAEQLYRIDPVPGRGACVYGIALLKNGRLDDAECVLRTYLEKHGDDGPILTNLAKVHAARNDREKAEEILWHALEVDPNGDNGLLWYEAIHRERGGEEAGQDALRRVAALPGSWRAQLWLARHALQAERFQEALALYQESLARVTKPVPADVLMQMSGDLGNAGRLQDILRLVEPHFDVRTHGLSVGNNLIKAHLDLGQFDAARRILDQLYAENRMDWKQTLSFWDTEIAKARIASSPADEQAPMKMALLTDEGPVWLKSSSPAAELLPAKSPDVPVIALLGGTAETAETAGNSPHVQRQLADLPGRMSRAIPLFLTEQLEFNSRARARTLVPWIVEPSGAFLLGSYAWKDEDAANYSRQEQVKSDYVVISHLKTQTEPWTVELRLVRSIDGRCLGDLAMPFPPAQPEQTIPDLARRLLELLAEQAGVEAQTPPPFYQVPSDANFAFYLLRLEQLFAVRCSSMEEVKADFLNGEREILDGNLQLCLACPDNVCTRILLGQTLLAMKKVRPDILPEFREKIALLEDDEPLPEPAQTVIHRMFHEALGGGDSP